MQSVSVCWHEGSLDGDSRSRYADAGLLNETFDKLGCCNHYTPFNSLPPDTRGAVVVVHGGNEQNQVDNIVADLNTLKWALVVVFCDDEASFNTRRLVAPNRKIWQQMPIPGKHDFVDRRIICGYPGDAPQHLARFNQRSVDRHLDWFFAGQVNHPRRYACTEQLRRIPNGCLVETPGFWQGLSRPEYYEKMSQAKIIPCPAGPVTPDTIRMAEALEAGCVPLIDDKPGARAFPTGFWPYVLGENPPFPVISDWSDLPRVMDEQLAQWPANRDRCLLWWTGYKQSWIDNMRADIEELRAKCER